MVAVGHFLRSGMPSMPANHTRVIPAHARIQLPLFLFNRFYARNKALPVIVGGSPNCCFLLFRRSLGF